MIVIGLTGYTKCRKSTLARYLENNANFSTIEMSDPIRESIVINKGTISNVNEIIEELNHFRKKHGKNILAKIAFDKMNSFDNDKFAIIGIRSIEDHEFLKHNLKDYCLIFIHTTTRVRHQRLLKDPTSIAKNKLDFKYLDIQGNIQGAANLANEADFIIVNDDGYPLTLYEQMENILLSLKEKNASKIEIRDFNNNIILKRSNKMNEKGYIIKELPVYENKIPENGDLISRVLKKKGELTNISIEPSCYIAYVTFPVDGVPRANHYHEEKKEYLYLIKGKVKLSIRRGGRPEEKAEEVIVNEGSLVFIKPGWAHAYETLEEGYAIEFSPTKYEIILKDKVRDYVVEE